MVAAVPGTGSTARRDIRGLKPGTEYCFSVRAYKLAGSYDWSAKSNERCITMPAIVWPLLSLGANGESVRTVQYLLRQHGADVVVDGDYGPQTRAAVTAFNVANGIGKSALPGSQRVLLSATWEKLIVPVQQGSQGEAVRAVQSQLASRGMGVVVDGDFGPQTAQAVKTYQQQRGLAADGIVSAAMWSALVNLK
jgi:peptidoglycan hydrolase-like protein with peptidoglycan-binding domain